GALNHFLVEAAAGGAIPTTAANAPIALRITAQDVANNTATSFASTVDISSTGTLTAGGGTSGTFTAGVLSPSVTISNEGTWTVTATKTGGTEAGASAPFFVDVAPTVGTTTPANGATGVAVTTTITIPFSKSVNATTSSFVLNCPSTGTARPYTLSASPAASYTLTPSASLPGGTGCQVTVVAAQVADANGFHPAADVVVGFTTGLTATADVYPQTVFGNVSVNSSYMTPMFSVTANDNLDPSVPVTFAGWSSVPYVTEHGGVVAMTASGSARGQFAYDPPAGFIGYDHVTYTVDNGTASASATVELQVLGDMVWFIDNNQTSCAPVCDGRLTHPFNSLAAFQAVNDGVGTHPRAGQSIFLYNSPTSYIGPVTLLTGQKLIGQNATVDIPSIVGIIVRTGSASYPSMNVGPGIGFSNTTIAGAAGGVVLAPGASASIHGLTIATTGGTAVASAGPTFSSLGFSNGYLETPDVTINATGGGALDLTSGRLAGAIQSVSSTGGTSAIQLATVTGSLAINGGALSGASGPTVSVSGGTANLTVSASVSQSNANRLVQVSGVTGGTINFAGTLSATGASTGIAVQSNTGGTVTFSGASKTLNLGATTGISLTGNTGATIAFTGGALGVTTTSGTAFDVSGGGTVSVQGASNVLRTTGGGTALSVQNTTIAAAGLNFQAINAAGGLANGIVLKSTGTLGGLTVTGTGGTCNRIDASGCTGGTIGGTTGPDGTSGGIGVYLNSTANVSLTRMHINGTHTNFGLYGTAVSGTTTLSNLLMDGGYGDNAAVSEGAVSFDELSGSATVTSGDFSNGVRNNFRIHNALGGTNLNRITFTGTTFGATYTGAASGDGLQVVVDAGTTNTTVQSSNFLGGYAYGAEFDVNGGTADVTFLGNSVTNTQSLIGPFYENLAILADGTNATTGNITYAIGNGQAGGSNTFTKARDAAVRISKTHGQWTITGQIISNTIGTNITTNSGSLNAEGIRIEHTSQGKHKALISSNIIQQYNGGAGLNAQFLGNTT
ncbi:MAG: hypothetical protein JWN53_2527, partial [Gemmatimonadetes bacterium]|nr:hypothetical protein [Gemmatimonadota bacterium]